MLPWRATMALFVWTVAMAVALLLYEGRDVTCGPEIYRNCQVGLKVTAGLGRPGIVLLWGLGVVVLAITWLTTRGPRREARLRAADLRSHTPAAHAAAGSNQLTGPLPSDVRDRAPTVGEAEEYGRFQPYAGRDGLLAGYRIEGLLSHDPLRHVTYQATTSDGRRVALKLFQLRSGMARRFRRQIRIRASIEHPNLLPIFDWGKIDEHHYVAMGLCQAPTLAELLKAGPITTERCLHLLGQLADALETAHERGLIHCELAPENVLVSPSGGGHVWLGDFGTVGSEPAEGALVEVAAHTGYVPPEELMDQPLTSASNVYSLACILVECLTGSPPYPAELTRKVAYAHACEPPPLLSERRSDLPRAIDDLVAAAMAKDPNERPESARWTVAAAAASLGLEAPPSALHGARGDREPEPSSVNGSSGDGALGPPARAAPELPVRRLRVKSRLSGSPARIAARRSARQPIRARTAGLPRSALALGLVLVAAGSGTVGLVLARSDDGTATDRNTAVDAARLRSQSERTRALRAADVTLERLDARRAKARLSLATARTRRAQATAAARLVKAYHSAAGAVSTEFQDTAGLAFALNRVTQAYRRLAAAVRQGSRRRYAIAAGAVRRHERGVQSAVARLNQGRR